MIYSKCKEVSCHDCDKVLRERGLPVLNVHKTKRLAYFCCDVFGIVPYGSKCYSVKKRKIKEDFYIKTLRSAN